MITDYEGFTTAAGLPCESCLTSSLGQSIPSVLLPFQITSDYVGLKMQSIGASLQGMTYTAFQNVGTSSVPKQGDSSYQWAKVSIITTTTQSNVGVQQLPVQTVGQIWPT